MGGLREPDGQLAQLDTVLSADVLRETLVSMSILAWNRPHVETGPASFTVKCEPRCIASSHAALRLASSVPLKWRY